MTPSSYRKKPVVIEALRWTGDNYADVCAWVDSQQLGDAQPGLRQVSDLGLGILTLEGEMRADPGDWIIRGVKGEFYPCKPHIFEATYELADEGA